MSQRIRLWIDGAETEPMEESDVRDRVVSGELSNLTLARPEDPSRSDWKAVGAVLAEADGNPKPHGTPPAKTSPARTACRALVATALVAVIVGSMAFLARVMPGLYDVPVTSRAAYSAARNFALDQLPGAQKIAPESQSIVERDGDTWRVAFRVDGLNAFGGPVRRNVAVEMRHDGASFSFVRLKQ